MAKKQEPKHVELENVEHALTASELFIEKHQKQILIGVATVVLVVLAILSFRNFYMEPREVNAENEMYKAQALFATDSFRVALDGNGNQIMGFKEIISEYGMTPTANLAAAYAGICSYKLGKYEDAIKYLSQYDGSDTYIKTTIVGLTGDSYIELGETTKAISYFDKAAEMDNAILSPVYIKKAGLVYESLNQPEKAEKKYTTIKEKYPKSSEAADIDKYLARVQK